jgi:hypothetical protein
MNTILFVWTIVGFAGTQNFTREQFDWRPLGEFKTPEDCQRAAKQLELDKLRFRCISTGRSS